MKKRYAVDMMVVGFALFAIFFGAGNLIFPPALGVLCGTEWKLGFLFYYIADIGLAVAGVLAMIKWDGKASKLAEPLGRIPAAVMTTAIILCVGPGLAIPRTAATTYELGIVPLLGIEGNRGTLAILSVVFFAIVLALTIRPSKVVDIVGKFLTPVLLAALTVLIIVGILHPAGQMQAPATQHVVREGVLNGYQTLDIFGTAFVSALLLKSIRDKGHTSRSSINLLSRGAAGIAAVLLLLVYGGLAFLGAGTGSLWKEAYLAGEINQASLLTNITYALLGRSGLAILAVVVASACLTTAIGLVSATAEYFETFLNGKVSYKTVAVITCVVSACLCNLGLSQIISISAPVLMLMYPLTILMVLTAWIRDYVPEKLPYRLSGAVTLAVSIMEVLGGTFGIASMVRLDALLPFSELGFSWLVPAVVSFLAGIVLVRINGSERKVSNEAAGEAKAA